ncbi:MAG TPA: maleylacetoacetate isomerase [Gammaproteobacteria bacterium]|jgi:maleylpyruvate isomerase|nr:maleylacetoacetate isomerase [Gammaproteobacteria bacterium]
MQLYTYFRSTAAYRVRIALNLKELEAEQRFVHLVRDGGEQHGAGYRQLNPQGLVPTFVNGGAPITQSLAIIEYLEEKYPQSPLLPKDPAGRARVRALAQTVACDIHPLNNLRVLQYLERELGADKPARDQWYRHWIKEGFDALESMLASSPATGRYCHGDTPGLADICLVPQVFNARRFECDLGPFPTITRIERACLELEEFAKAAPENQPDAP